jgi:hypothetical protein
LHRKEIGKFPPWFENNELPLSPLHGGCSAFGLFDQFAKLLRNCNMAQFRLVSSSLHGDRQELPVVPFDMALEKRNHVAS